MQKCLCSLVSCMMFSVAIGQNGTPLVLGYSDTLVSQVLGEKRVLNIYFPEGYVLDDTSRYPVVYLLDGGMDEDFIHVAGIFQFNNFPWIDRVPRSIIVGIVNTDRRRDFAYPTTIPSDKETYPTTGGSAQFIRFLETELQPYINDKYRTTNHTLLIGQSLGGLVATEILFEKPALFDQYLIVSPSLWWDNGSLLNRKPMLLNASFRHPVDIYLAVGKEGLTPGAFPRVMEADANLLADMIASSKSLHVKITFDYLPEEDHATIMHLAVFRGLRELYPRED